jgi:hypothetical protein
MELNAAVSELLGSIDNQVIFFERLFHDIVPPLKQQHNGSHQLNSNSELNQPSRPISVGSLSLSQKQDIAHFSTNLSKARDAAGKIRRLTSTCNSSVPTEVELQTLKGVLAEKTKAEKSFAKTICTLQDYLVNELNRAETLESELKAKENELLQMTVEKNKYQKLSLHSSNGSRSNGKALFSGSDVAASTVVKNEHADLDSLYDESHTDLIGCFVRKKFGSNYFFGLVISLEHPYYKVNGILFLSHFASFSY